MSNELLTTSRRVLLAPFVEIIEDECLDLAQEIGAETFANKVFVIADHIRQGSTKVTDYPTILGDSRYLIRVNNNLNGFVSVSDVHGSTGVSNTLYYPFFEDDEDEFAGLLTLAQMINEAWYQCNN